MTDGTFPYPYSQWRLSQVLTLCVFFTIFSLETDVYFIIGELFLFFPPLTR